MSKKRRQESKSDRKKRCSVSASKRRGAKMYKSLNMSAFSKAPRTFEEAVEMGILK